MPDNEEENGNDENGIDSNLGSRESVGHFLFCVYPVQFGHQKRLGEQKKKKKKKKKQNRKELSPIIHGGCSEINNTSGHTKQRPEWNDLQALNGDTRIL